MQAKVAIITGGGSGIGLATAKALRGRGWTISVFDMNAESGAAAASELGGDFYRVDVTDYNSLATAFDGVFKKHGRLDFVFANAGIVEKFDFFKQEATTPPPPLNQVVVDVNLKSVVSTTYLAQHYFRLNKTREFSPALILTASTASIHPAPNLPVYAAVKHAVLGLGRSLAPMMWKKDQIQVSCICPGTIRTNLVEGWIGFPDELFTPIDSVVAAVVRLVNDSKSAGKVLEIVGTEVAEVPRPNFETTSCNRLMQRLESDALQNA